MPTATPTSLTTDQIDDLLYLARLGETSDLTTAVDLLAKTLSTTPATILAAAVDRDSGNGLLHMAAANGHTETMRHLLALSSSSSSSSFSSPSSSNHAHALSINLQNASGNTPLHWAALNGHLSAVQLLVGAGADVTITNKAGRDAVFEAEGSEKGEVVAWLLTEGEGGGKSADGDGDGGGGDEGAEEGGGVGGGGGEVEGGAEGGLELVMGEGDREEGG